MGRLHTLRHLDVTRQQIASPPLPTPTTRLTIRKPSRSSPTHPRRSQQPHRRLRISRILGPRRHSSHHHRIPRGARRHGSHAPPLVANAVHGRRATGCRPGSVPQRHHHRTLRSNPAHAYARLGADAWLLQIHSVGRASNRYRGRLPACRMDHLPVVRAAHRHFRSDGRWPIHHDRHHSRHRQSCDLCIARLIFRLLPHIRRHRDGACARDLDQRTLEITGIGTLDQFHDNRGCLHRIGDWRMPCRRSGPHHSARPLRSTAQPVRLHKPVERHAFVHQKQQGRRAPHRRKPARRIERATSGHGPFRRQRMEPVRFHHVVGLLQLPSRRHLHHQQRRRQEIHRNIHREQRPERLLATHCRSRIQRDLRQQ